MRAIFFFGQYACRLTSPPFAGDIPPAKIYVHAGVRFGYVEARTRRWRNYDPIRSRRDTC